MRISSACSRRDRRRCVAIGARALAVARDAKAGIALRLERVSRAEARSVQPRETNLVESETPGERRNEPHSMAARALPFAVARSAEIARSCGPHTVLANPVAVVDEMARRQDLLARQIDVTP